MKKQKWEEENKKIERRKGVKKKHAILIFKIIFVFIRKIMAVSNKIIFTFPIILSYSVRGHAWGGGRVRGWGCESRTTKV